MLQSSTGVKIYSFHLLFPEHRGRPPKNVVGNVVYFIYIQGGSNMTGTDLYVNKPHCAAAVRP